MLKRILLVFMVHASLMAMEGARKEENYCYSLRRKILVPVVCAVSDIAIGGDPTTVLTTLVATTVVSEILDCTLGKTGGYISKGALMIASASSSPFRTIGSLAGGWFSRRVMNSLGVPKDSWIRQFSGYACARAGGAAADYQFISGVSAAGVTAQECPTLTGPFSVTCNVTKAVLNEGPGMQTCTQTYTCFDSEGFKVRGEVRFPADREYFYDVNNIDGVPTIPGSLMPIAVSDMGSVETSDCLTIVPIDPSVHTQLCSSVSGTFSDSCTMPQPVPVMENGIPCCSLSGTCKDLVGRSQKIEGVIVAPGLYGDKQSNIENCGGKLAYGDPGKCASDLGRKTLKGVSVEKGHLLHS